MSLAADGDCGDHRCHTSRRLLTANYLPDANLRSAGENGQDFAGWRKVRGLTTAQVADQADISQHALRKLEHGDPGVRFRVAVRVARALGFLEILTPNHNRTILGGR